MKTLLNTVHAQEIAWGNGVPETLEEPARRGWKIGLVYMIGEAGDGPFKIGLAADPVKRLRQLQTGNPRHLRIEQLILGFGETEKLMHAWARPDVLPGRVRARGLNGARARDTEWFASAARTETTELLREIAAQQRGACSETTPEQMHDIAVRAVALTGREIVEGDTVNLLARSAGYVKIPLMPAA